MFRKSICLFLFVLLLGLATASQAAVETIYYDNFDGSSGTPLNGQAPDMRPGSEVWVAGPNDFDADGTITWDNVDFGDSAYLPFTPVSGYTYTLSATIQAFSGPNVPDNNWIAIGFTQTNGNPESRFFNDNGSRNPIYWGLTRTNSGSLFDQTFTGPDTSGPLDTATTSADNLKIVLNTTQTTWVVTWYYNNVLQRTVNVADAQKPNFQYVAISENRCNGIIDDFTLTRELGSRAASPNPASGASGVPQTAVLSWLSGKTAVTHDVYLDTSFNDVNTATRASHAAIDFYSQNQAANSYDPPGLLTSGGTYYWRVDEVNGAPDYTIFKGAVWSFTVVTAPGTLYYDNFDGTSADLDGTTPDITIGTNVWDAGVWVNADGTYGGGSSGQSFTAALPFPRKIGAVYELSATLNNTGNDWIAIAFLNAAPNVGIRINDNTPYLWELVRGALGGGKDQSFTGAGTGGGEDSSTFNANDLKVRVEMINSTTWVVKWFFDGSLERVATVNPNTLGITNETLYAAFGGNGMFSPCYGTISSFKLDEIPQAMNPYPANESMIFTTSITLNWQPGLYADKDDVYIGTSFDDVNNANTSTVGIYKGRQDPNNYPLTGLTPGATYYWRIDSVSLGGAPIYKGDIWSFTLQPLEAYDPSPADGGKYLDADINLGWSAGASAVTHDVYLDDNFNDVNAASRASHANITYYSQNQAATTYDPPSDLTLGTTYYWRIDEVSSGGAPIYKGDVWSFQIIPNIPVTDAHLLCWWKLDEDWGTRAVDWSGHSHHGTLINGPAWVNGHIDGALQFDGLNDQVSLPIGSVINSLDSATIMTWVNWTRIGAPNQRIFDFGAENDANGMFLSPGNGGGGGSLQFNLTTSVGNVSLTSTPLAAGWHNIAITIDQGALDITLYIDGVEQGLADTTTVPSDLGSTVDNWLGRSQAADYTWFIGLLDDFRIYDIALTGEQIGQIMAPPEAWLPDPPDNATHVDAQPTLSWNPGVYADKHDVYFDIDLSDVQNGSRANHPGLMYYSQGQDANSYAIPANLNSDTTYYWRVDEVNGGDIWKGNVWRFTTRDLTMIDDFETYTDTGLPRAPGTLRNTWIGGYYQVTFPSSLPLDATDGKSGAYIQLASDTNDGTTNPASPAFDGDDSMKFYYDNDGTITWLSDLYGYDPYYSYVAPKYSEALAAIVDAGRLSTSHESRGIPNDFNGYKLLRVPYYGDTTNTVVASDKLYVTLRDADGTEVTISNPDQTILQKPGWYLWYIKMSSFASNPNLDLTNIVRIYIGIGNKSSPVSGGRGAIFLDEIKLMAEGACIPGTVLGDFDEDCAVGPADLQRMTELWLGEPPVGASPIISLDASGLSLGTLTSWTNSGTAGGVFEDFNSAITGYRPTVEMVDGVKAVVFDGNDIMRADFNAPAEITGSHAFTVIYKVWNLSRGTDEEIFCWAKRGTTARYAAACYASGTAYAAAALWGTADVGFDRGSPAAHTWHTIALTYEGGTDGQFYVITDGQVNTSVLRSLDLWPDCQMTIGAAYNGDSNLTRDLSPGYWYSGALAKLDVYDYYMTAGQLAMKMGTPVNLKNDSVIDFKDVAILANKWLVGPVLFE